MSISTRCKKLIFRNAVLDARIAIRDYFLNTVVSEMYENIGQSLSFVHLQLSLWGTVNGQPACDILAAKVLVAKSIKDMRFLCKRLYFSAAEPGENKVWIEGIEYTIKSLNLSSGESVRPLGKQEKMHPELQTLLFRTVQEILFAIKEQRFGYHTTRVMATRKQIVIEVIYLGTPLTTSDFDKAAKTDASSNQRFTDRLRLVGAALTSETLRSKKARIKLEVPVNLSLYE